MDMVIFSNDGGAVDDAVRTDPSARANLHIGADGTPRIHAHIRREARRGINNGAFVYHVSIPRKAPINSALATGCSSTLAITSNFHIPRVVRKSSALKIN